jgi:hypothetical protein
MGRVVKDWKPVEVDSIAPAPHRYLHSGVIGDHGQRLGEIEDAPTYGAAKSCIPYKEGEVVYVEHNGEAKRALIYKALMDRDRYGDRREYYLLQVETAKGVFSKLWEKAWPGFVQRGYHRAGLAPDLDGK